MRRRPSVVLGSSGLVGQRMQQRLVNHPWFEMVAVCGSSKRAGTTLDAVEWRLEEQRPSLPNLTVLDLAADDVVETLLELKVEVAFSCIPSEIAESIEPRLAKAGIAVFSNASFHRRKPGVPLVIPDINPEHLDELSDVSPIACATNCTLLPLAVPLFTLKHFGIKRVVMRSEQALSGAGWQLLHDNDALRGNVNPEIPGEAVKTRAELLHVFGTTTQPANFEADITCQRVARRDGHQVFVEVEFRNDLTRQEVLRAFAGHRFSAAVQACPSAPFTPLHVVESIDIDEHLWTDGSKFTNRPNPSTDLRTGMAVVVGDIELVDARRLKFSGYSHNTVRGAAGGTLLLAEQAVSEGRIE